MILDLGSSIEVVRVTVEYSNAVLLAVMPYISDVAHKLDLPLPQPVTVEQVSHCTVNPVRKAGDIAVGVGIKGNWEFSFQRGYVDTIQGPNEFFTLQDFDKTPEFYGEVRMTKAEAVAFARGTLGKLGIPLESVFAEQEPHVTGPVQIGTNLVPHYRVEWIDPRAAELSSVDMDVDGNARQLARLRIFNSSLERSPPKINVVASPDANFPRWLSTNPEYARRLIPIALRAIDEYGQKLSLPIPRPLTTNHVAQLSLADNGGWPHAEIELTNGWKFIYRNSMVNGFYAPDNFFNSDSRPILIKDFVGEWKMTEVEAIDLVKRSLAKLNYPSNLVHMDFAPRVIKPAVPGIPRYNLWWWRENETHDDLLSKVEAEVDADRRELKSFYFDSQAFWNKPPPVGVPISLPQPPEAGGRQATETPPARIQPMLPR